MSRKVMISCAVTGAGESTKINPAVPVTPEDIARECLEAAAAGAAIVHIHVRDPSTGAPSMDNGLYARVVERIRDSGSDVIINLTTGPGARIVLGADDPKEFAAGTTMSLPSTRVSHVEALKPELCSLDIGSFNFGAHVFVNIPRHVDEMADKIRSAGVKPELEVFDLGGIRQAKALIEGGHVAPPYLFQLCLGIPWAAEATPETMIAMRNLLPADAIWFSFGVSRQQFPMAALAVILGGHVRVGLEDNLYLSRGVLAPGNASLVERAVAIIQDLGDEVASPNDARQMLSIKQ